MQGNLQERRWRPSWMLWAFVGVGMLFLFMLWGLLPGSIGVQWSGTISGSIHVAHVEKGIGKTAVSPQQTLTTAQTAVLTQPTLLRHAAFSQPHFKRMVGAFDRSNEQDVETAVRTLPLEPTQRAPLFSQLNEFESILSKAPLEDAQLIIPSINVVQNIGIVPIVNGEWDISVLGAGVGHLTSTGVAPGDDLAMTFVGHATIPWPHAGAFADLIRVEHGEEIIYRWNGNDYIYEVTRILIVTPDYVEGVYEQNGNMLMLATCSGWSDTELDYTKRMITRAELVRVIPSPVSMKVRMAS